MGFLWEIIYICTGSLFCYENDYLHVKIKLLPLSSPVKINLEQKVTWQSIPQKLNGVMIMAWKQYANKTPMQGCKKELAAG